jgi:hypothetical protein
MKTSQLIDLYTTAVSALYQLFETYSYMDTQTQIDAGKHGAFAYLCDVVRDIHDSLPEILKNPDFNDCQLFPHLHKLDDACEDIDLDALQVVARLYHSHAYGLWEQLQEARDKFGL